MFKKIPTPQEYRATILTQRLPERTPNLSKVYEQLGLVVQAVEAGTASYVQMLQILNAAGKEERLAAIIADKLETLMVDTEMIIKLIVQHTRHSETQKAALTTSALVQGATSLKWLKQFVTAVNQADQDTMAPIVAELQRVLIEIDKIRKHKVRTAAQTEEYLSQIRHQTRRPKPATSTNVQGTPAAESISATEEPIETVQELLAKARFELLSKERV